MGNSERTERTILPARIHTLSPWLMHDGILQSPLCFRGGQTELYKVCCLGNEGSFLLFRLRCRQETHRQMELAFLTLVSDVRGNAGLNSLMKKLHYVTYSDV